MCIKTYIYRKLQIKTFEAKLVINLRWLYSDKWPKMSETEKIDVKIIPL